MRREQRRESERSEAAGAKKRRRDAGCALEERTAILLEERQRLGLLLYVEEARGVGLQQAEAALLVCLRLVRDALPRLQPQEQG